jgi:hypothetical protein
MYNAQPDYMMPPHHMGVMHSPQSHHPMHPPHNSLQSLPMYDQIEHLIAPTLIRLLGGMQL